MRLFCNPNLRVPKNRTEAVSGQYLFWPLQNLHKDSTEKERKTYPQYALVLTATGSPLLSASHSSPGQSLANSTAYCFYLLSPVLFLCLFSLPARRPVD